MDNSFSEFVTFIDSDDLYLPDHLASRVEIMRRNPSLDLLSGGFSGDTDIYVPDYRDPENMVHISECILCGTLFGDRRMFEELDGFADIAYAEDTDLWQRALQHGFNVRKIDGPETYVYRQSDDSITRNFTPISMTGSVTVYCSSSDKAPASFSRLHVSLVTNLRGRISTLCSAEAMLD